METIPITPSEYQDLNNRFTYHAPKPGQPAICEMMRNEAKDLAMFIMSNCPRSRECSLAITHLEEAIFWANAGIARHG